VKTRNDPENKEPVAMSRLQLLIAVLCLGAPIATTEAHAWGLGISIGVPLYYPRPYYPGWGYYYRPYPYVYAAPAPVVVAPAPVVVPSVPVVAQTAPVPTVAPLPAANVVPATAPAPLPVVQANSADSAARVEQYLAQLNNPQESARRDAAIELGRLKAAKAVDPLVRILSADASPVVRDAAARGLGLIGSPQGLSALIQAAQVDQDRDVRHSAQFAVEIIRTNLRGN
jgi:HEAT repeats